MFMSDVQCRCKKKATHICIRHLVYICESEKVKHDCEVITLSDFTNKIRKEKVNLVKKLGQLKQESMQNRQDLLCINKEQILWLKKLGELVKSKIDNTVDYYNKMNEALIAAKTVQRVSDIENRLNHWENSQSFISLYKFLKTMSFGKLRKQERDIYGKCKENIKNSNLKKEIEILLKQFHKTLNFSLITLNEIKKTHNDQFNNKQSRKKMSSFFLANENFFANRSTLKTNLYLKKKRKNKSGKLKFNQNTVQFTTINRRMSKTCDINNFRSNLANIREMTPLDTDYLGDMKKKALLKIKSSGLSNDSGSLSSIDADMEDVFASESEDDNEEIRIDNHIKPSYKAIKKENSLLYCLELLKESIKKKQEFDDNNRVEVEKAFQDFFTEYKNVFLELSKTEKFTYVD